MSEMNSDVTVTRGTETKTLTIEITGDFEWDPIAEIGHAIRGRSADLYEDPLDENEELSYLLRDIAEETADQVSY